MNCYHCAWPGHKLCNTVEEENHGWQVTVNLRLDLHNYSNETDWGYNGTRPSQVALAILAHRLNDDKRALELHVKFRQDVIAKVKDNHLHITHEQIDEWLKEQV